MSQNQYAPDRWVVVKISQTPQAPRTTKNSVIYKVFGSWGSGYTKGSSWRLNSGISRVLVLPDSPDFFRFEGYSGSTYICHSQGYGTFGATQGVLDHYAKVCRDQQFTLEVMDEHTDWLSLTFEP